MLPDVRQQQAEQERQKRRRNRHKALAGEEAEEFRQLHGVEAVVTPAARIPQIRPPKTPICNVGMPTTMAYFPPWEAISGVMLSTVLMVMLVTNTETAAESGNAGFRSQSDGRADGEEHWQVIKDNPAGVHHQRQVELIAEGQQQARSGKQ